jgi:hypothetical protein
LNDVIIELDHPLLLVSKLGAETLRGAVTNGATVQHGWSKSWAESKAVASSAGNVSRNVSIETF